VQTRLTRYSSALNFLACPDKRATTALLLVDAGAALDTADASGRRALDWADDKGLGAVAAAIRARGGRAGVGAGASFGAAGDGGGRGGASAAAAGHAPAAP